MGTRGTDKGHRQRLRKRLRAEGWPDDVIERRVDRLRARQQAARDRARAGEPAASSAADGPLRCRSCGGECPRWSDLAEHERVCAGPAAERERLIAETHARLSPDDRRHRPATPDPLERGTARVSPATAQAARRRKATTKYEYDQRHGGAA